MGGERPSPGGDKKVNVGWWRDRTQKSGSEAPDNSVVRTRSRSRLDVW